jgi:hypothetical protein
VRFVPIAAVRLSFEGFCFDKDIPFFSTEFNNASSIRPFGYVANQRSSLSREAS